MGDEVHNRNVAASSLLLKRLVPALLRTNVAPAEIAAVVDFVAGNDHFFLNLSMAACKAMLDAAHGAQQHGDRDGAQRRRVRDPPERHRRRLVHRTRAGGRGPAVPRLHQCRCGARPRRQRDHRDRGPRRLRDGGLARDRAVRRRLAPGRDRELAMGHITLGRNGAFTLPALDFTGTPAGIDARKVVDSGIAPIINTGIAHKQAGIGQIGAGITRAPLACFAKAVRALAEQVEAA